MEYLEAVLLEGLRLHPPTSHLSRTCTEETSLIPGGPTIEPGVEVQVFKFKFIFYLNHYVGIRKVPVSGLCSDPSLYPRPDRFDPRRFLGRPKICGEEASGRFLAFGAGPRGCPGRAYAMLVAKAGMAALMAR